MILYSISLEFGYSFAIIFAVYDDITVWDCASVCTFNPVSMRSFGRGIYLFTSRAKGEQRWIYYVICVKAVC